VSVLIATKLALSRLVSLQIAYFRNPKYHVYKQKLAELTKVAEQEDAIRNPNKGGIQLDMILENTHEESGASPFNVRKSPFGNFGGQLISNGGQTPSSGGVVAPLLGSLKSGGNISSPPGVQ
jgi:hypothetical protein